MNGNVGHGYGRSGAMPVLFTRKDRDHVTRPYLLDRPTPALHETAASRHDQSLAERMGVSGRARAGLEGDISAAGARRLV
jgi:hypothetical protein